MGAPHSMALIMKKSPKSNFPIDTGLLQQGTMVSI
jgi:hypothetical protein